ncbi:hypothetical protein ACEXQD_12930 [Herbiconiux sp. P15]|uniref:hypothetical protein n=1 Tax=Herbiconiux liukaitaii TaxID=3342799 RepID=UPI0035B817A4
MPVTNELGDELERRLKGEIGFDLRDDQTFEDWLTLQITPMPFMEGYRNSRRMADAAKVIATIAEVLDEYVRTVSAGLCPKWLRQLIAIWDAEQAAVLTFNYDSLVERAVNTYPPASGVRRGFLGRIQGDHVVFPAPPTPASQLVDDEGVEHSIESFQLLKLHGSLNWYWADGDKSGSTLVRVRERHTFGASNPFVQSIDFSAATTLDRYLIPPVSSKDGYYGSYLANTLWRSARQLIAETGSLTLMGYSLPFEDRVASQLIGQLTNRARAEVVDYDPGSVEPRNKVLGRLASLGLNATSASSGSTSMEDFVSAKVAMAIRSLPASWAFSELTAAHGCVVIGISKPWGDGSRSAMYMPAFNSKDGVYDLHFLDHHVLNQPFKSPQQWVADSNFEQSGLSLADVVDTETLLRVISSEGQFCFRHPDTKETLVAIGARSFQYARSEGIELKWTIV